MTPRTGSMTTDSAASWRCTPCHTTILAVRVSGVVASPWSIFLGRGERRSEDKRQEILGAARTLFVAEGYADTGMEVVARRAAVSTATLYAYFPSKADLFRTTVDEMVIEIADGMWRSAADSGDVRTRLVAFSRAYAEGCSNPQTRAVLRMVCAERPRFGDSARSVEARVRDEIGGAAIRLVSQLVDDGSLSVEKPSWAASHLLGMIEHATLIYGLVRGDGAHPARPLEDICEDAVVTFLARYGVVKETAG